MPQGSSKVAAPEFEAPKKRMLIERSTCHGLEPPSRAPRDDMLNPDLRRQAHQPFFGSAQEASGHRLLEGGLAWTQISKMRLRTG